MWWSDSHAWLLLRLVPVECEADSNILPAPKLYSLSWLLLGEGRTS